MSSKPVPEQCDQAIDYAFLDPDGVVMGTAPDSARWRVDDSAGDEVLDWQSIAVPLPEGRIVVPAASLAVLDRSRSREVRVVQLEGAYGGGQIKRDRVEIVILRMPGLT